MVEYILLVQKANTHIGASRFMRVFSLMIEDLLVLIAFVETSRDGGALNFRERDSTRIYFRERKKCFDYVEEKRFVFVFKIEPSLVIQS